MTTLPPGEWIADVYENCSVNGAAPDYPGGEVKATNGLGGVRRVTLAMRGAMMKVS